MPDVGTPSSSVSSPSHTSSEQWQSFEIRMRQRRAERCVARAEAALEAGRDDEAREALSEAHALNRQSPDFETLKARVVERHAATAAAARRTKRLKVSFAVAAAASLFALGAVAFLGSGRADNPAAIAAGAPAVRAAPPASAPLATGNSAESQDQAGQNIVSTGGKVIPESQTEVPATIEPETVAAVPADVKIPDPEPPAVVVTPPKPPTTSPPPLSVPVPNEPALPPVNEVKPELKIAAPTTTDAMNSRSVPPATAVDRLPSGLPSAAAPEPTAPAIEERVVRADDADEQRVRAVLAQFEAAYSSLNAAAARAVWPSVDERSLARAFASLESQRVSLGACAVRVMGAVARADCNGTTSWTPKIGGGGRTEPRRWSFDLQSANGAWRIVRAEAR